MAQDGELGELEGDDVLSAFAGDLLAVVIAHGSGDETAVALFLVLSYLLSQSPFAGW